MQNIYEKATAAWQNFAAFRSDRSRCKRYVFGDQWDDSIMVNGVKMREHEFIRSLGQNPMKNNLLRRILRNVIGVYRANYKVPQVSATDCDVPAEDLDEINGRRRMVFAVNRMDQLLPRLLEEFLISGIAAVRVDGGIGGSPRSVRILPVTPDNFFFHSDGYDPRGWDVDMVGEVHNVSFRSLMEQLCRTPEEMEKVEGIYAAQRDADLPCRVTEVWHRDVEAWGLLHDAENSRLERLPMDEIRSRFGRGKSNSRKMRSHYRTVWRCSWFAEDGSLLKQTEEGFDRHPYVWKAYPFIDGEVHSYVCDIIDQQRYVNHLITLYDFIMKSSAKGVLLFPDESIPRGMSLEDVAEEWSRFNGVIPYRAAPGVPLPTQVSGNAANIGITELLKIEMQMLEDISGVSPTLQGKLESASTTSGTLFARQNAAAMTSLLDVVRSFDEFASDIARRL